MSSTQIRRHIRAPRAAVYRALVDREAIARWKVPTGMNCHIHVFEPWEGGAYRISLTYDAPTGTGKTTSHTDTYHGRFAKLVPNEQVVEVTEFETDNPAMQGAMTVTMTLSDVDGGTELFAVHDDVVGGSLHRRQRTGLAGISRKAGGVRRERGKCSRLELTGQTVRPFQRTFRFVTACGRR